MPFICICKQLAGILLYLTHSRSQSLRSKVANSSKVNNATSSTPGICGSFRVLLFCFQTSSLPSECTKLPKQMLHIAGLHGYDLFPTKFSTVKMFHGVSLSFISDGPVCVCGGGCQQTNKQKYSRF